MRATRFSALAVAVALGLSCLLTGCGSSAGTGSSGGGGSSTGGGNTGGSNSSEEIGVKYVYNGDGSFTTGDGSTVTESAGENGETILTLTYYDESETDLQQEAEEKGIVQTAETLTRGGNGNVQSVARSYVVSETYIADMIKGTNSPVATFVLNRALAEVNELFGLDDENEGGDHNEETVKGALYKLTTAYTYDESQNLAGAVIGLQPYHTADSAENSASITGRYTADDGIWAVDVSGNDSVLADVEAMMNKTEGVQAQLEQRGENCGRKGSGDVPPGRKGQGHTDDPLS